MHRSSVDLPEPDLPSRATISPSCRAKVMPSRTGRARPSGVVNVLVTCSAVMRTLGWVGAVLGRRVVSVLIGSSAGRVWQVSVSPAGVTASSGFGEPVQAAPEQPVDGDDVHAHDRDADEDLAGVAGGGGVGDVGAEAGGDEVVVAEVDDLGDDGGVPRPAGGGDAA